MQQKRAITQGVLDFPPTGQGLGDANLGAVMLEKSAADTVTEILKPQCFYVKEKKNEILSLHFGKFRLLLINPGKRAMRFILLGMGFLLLAIAFVLILRFCL